jgi:glycine/D-amino acid oxidase-like deaminating enzyme
MRKEPRIAVVGAGIIGSAIGLELVSRGADVTLVDAGGERASENSFGWINASWFNRPDYFRLRHFSMGVWRRWEQRISGLAPRWTGCLLWELDGEALEAFVRDYGAMGYAVRLINRDTIREIEPALADPPEQAALAAAEGFVDGGAAAAALRSAALAAGARLIEATVTAVEPDGVRLADGRRIGADRIVVAAGNGVPGLLGLPIHAVPGLMARTTPARNRIAHILTPPELNLRQDADGRILCAGGPGGSEVNANPQEIAQDLVARTRTLVGEPELELERTLIGHRPTPADGHPVIGPMPGRDLVYVAAMHSGVTLAPGVAELVAAELLDGTEALLLAPFRPSRFGG